MLAELIPRMADQNRTLDAVLIVGNDKEKGFIPGLAGSLGLRAPRRRLWIDSPVSSSTGCHPEQIEALRALLEPYDIVGVQSFHGLFVGSQMLAGPLGWECGHNPCCEGFRKATMAVRKAPQVWCPHSGLLPYVLLAYLPRSCLLGIIRYNIWPHAYAQPM